MATAEKTETEVTTRQLVDDLKTLVRDGTDLLKQSAGDLSDKGREAREKLSTALQSARETIQRLENKAVEGARSADRLIRDHPYPSLGIALGVGVLIGVLINRDRS